MRKILIWSMALAVSWATISAAGNIPASQGKLLNTNKSLQISSNQLTIIPGNSQNISGPGAEAAKTAKPVAKNDAIFVGKPLSAIAKRSGENVTPPGILLNGGDTYETATLIESLPFSDIGNTNGFADDYSGMCIPSGAPDVVYGYVADADRHIDVSLCGSYYDTGLIIFDATMTPLACNDNFCGYQSKIVDFAVTSGETYYIVVDGAGTEENSGAFTINVTESLETPPNDNCADVTPVTLEAGVTQTFTGDNTGATQDCPAPDGDMPEVWHAITTTECMDIVVDYCGTDPMFGYVYTIMNTGCPCSGRVHADYWTDQECPDYNWSIHYNNVPPGTYYIPVMYAPDYGSGGAYTLNVRGTACNPPVNDDCASVVPEDLTAGQTLTFIGNNDRASNDCPMTGAPEVWHAFTTTECLDVTLDYCATDPPFGNVFIAMTTGCPCDGFIATNDYTQEDCGNGNYKMRFYNVQPGTYYIPVLYDPFSQAAGPYAINVTGVACPPPPANDNCTAVTPIPLTSGQPMVFTGTNIGATVDCYQNNDPFPPYPEVWHAISVPERMNLKIDYCGTDPTFYNNFITMYTGCPCDNLVRAIFTTTFECTDNNNTIYFNGVEPGDYYIPILRDASTYSAGPYTMTVTGIAAPQGPPNDNCEDVVPATLYAFDTLTINGSNEWATPDCEITQGHAQVWEAFTTQEPLDVVLSFCGTTPRFEQIDVYLVTQCPCDPNFVYYTDNNNSSCTDTNFTVTYLNLPAGTYYVPIWSSPYNQGNYTLTIRSIGHIPPSTNDNCEDAVSIGDVTNLPFNTVNATADHNGSCDVGPNIWYKYTATCTGLATVSLCNSLYDTKLAVHDGGACEPPGEVIACNDNYCDLKSKVHFRCIAGNEYLIEVGGSNGETGAGFLTTSCGPPPPPMPTCDEGSLFGQSPTDFLAFWNYDVSDAGPELDRVLYDNFSGVTGDVCEVRFWGMDLYQGAMIEECNETAMEFRIAFYQDNNGGPGAEVQSYTVTPTCTHTGILYHDQFELNEYTASLSPCVSIANGWISIEGISVGGNVGDCWFFWMDSQQGDNNAYLNWGTDWFQIPYDWSFCLMGGGACHYTVGDANGSGTWTGQDVTYGVRFFKGGNPPPYSCECPAGSGHTWYVTGDVNGSCSFTGQDVTRMVLHFKSGVPAIVCQDCPPSGNILIKDDVNPILKPSNGTNKGSAK